MAYPLTEIVFLLLIAALLGGCFAWWLARRRFQNVSVEYARMRTEWSQWRRDVEARLGERPQHDLAPVIERLRSVESLIGDIRLPAYEVPDLSPVLDAVAAIRFPEIKPLDLTPMQSRIATLEQAVRGIVIPVQPLPKETDLSSVMARFAAVEQRISAIRITDPARPVDFAPMHGRIDRLEHAVRSIVIPVPKEHREVDLGGVFQRLQEIERQIEKIRLPELPPSTPVDLAPVLQSLSALQARLDRPAAAVAPAMPSLAATIRQGSANLLVSPVYGRPDDLKRINGVADVLEKTLHGVGVYYFWQVAEWSAADVAHVDAQLTAFKGRIARDHWIPQALDLAELPDSARKPAMAQAA